MLETHVTHAEQVHCFVARLQRVVIALEHASFGHCRERFVEIDNRPWHFAVFVFAHTVKRCGHGESIESIRAQHIEHQHALLRDHGATAFGHDRWMRDTFFVTHRHDLVDDVRRILWQRVVC